MKITASALSSFRRSRPDVLVLVGLCAITYGAWQIYEPVGFVVGGLGAICYGVLDSYVYALRKRAR